jgi:hypothetical protein
MSPKLTAERIRLLRTGIMAQTVSIAGTAITVTVLLAAPTMERPGFRLFRVETTFHATIFRSQIVNRSDKGDRLRLNGDPTNLTNVGEHKRLPETVAPKLKSGCERPYSETVSASMFYVAGRCIADVYQLDHPMFDTADAKSHREKLNASRQNG